MKFVINAEYGGFSISQDMARDLGVEDVYDSSLVLRRNPRLIEAVLDDTAYASGRHAELRVVEIPDDATDFRIEEYDGYENVIYVKDGKIWDAEIWEGDDDDERI